MDVPPVEIIQESEESSDDFIELDTKSSIPPQKSQQNSQPQTPLETCMICFDPLSNSGDHQISSLLCGHVYGLNCIQKWLISKQKCPHCGKRQTSSSIIPLFITSTTILDDSKNAQWRKKLKRSETDRKKALKIARELETRSNKLEEKYRSLNAKYKLLCTNGIQVINNSTYKKVNLENNITLSKMKPFTEAKFLKISNSLNSTYIPEYLISHSKSYVSIFTLGRNEETLILGQPSEKLVKDASFFSQQNLVLTVGFGKMAIITNCPNESVVNDISTNWPIWSCCVDNKNDCVFYCGYGNGAIEQFDTRYLEGPVSFFKGLGIKKPVHSLNMNKQGDLLVSSFSENFLVKTKKDNVEKYNLGELFLDLKNKNKIKLNKNNSFNDVNNLFFDCSNVFDIGDEDYYFFSTKKTKTRNSFLSVYKSKCDLNENNESYEFEMVNSFEDIFEHNLYFSKGCLFKEYEEIFVGIGSEKDNRVIVKSLNSDSEIKLIQHKNPILDVKYVDGSLLCLSGERLDIWDFKN